MHIHNTRSHHGHGEWPPTLASPPSLVNIPALIKICPDLALWGPNSQGSVARGPTLHGAPSQALHTLSQAEPHLHLVGTPGGGCPHPQVPQISRFQQKKFVSIGSKYHETPSPNFWPHSIRRKIVLLLSNASTKSGPFQMLPKFWLWLWGISNMQPK